MITNNPQLWLNLASPVIGEDVSHGTSLSRFKISYGCTPVVCGLIWSKINCRNLPDLKSFKQAHLLWGLHFLRKYPTEDDLAAKFNIKSNKTVRKWCRIAVIQIAMLKGAVVSQLSRN